MHVDLAHRGLGTLSCGPDTLPEYRVGPGRYRFTWILRPFTAPLGAGGGGPACDNRAGVSLGRTTLAAPRSRSFHVM